MNLKHATSRLCLRKRDVYTLQQHMRCRKVALEVDFVKASPNGLIEHVGQICGTQNEDSTVFRIFDSLHFN